MKRICIFALLLAAVATLCDAAQLMTRTAKEHPAIVLTAFGTSTKARVTYEVLEAEIRERFPDAELRWAFTSEVIRERVNRRNAEADSPDRLKSLQQALADLEAEGYTAAVVQPIHIFPGQEYEEVVGIAEHFPGIRTVVGETLMHRWEEMYALVDALSADFLPPGQGCNVLVAHGTPVTNVGSNIAYLGLERHLLKNYENVFVGGVDGVLTREEALGAAKRCEVKKVRFIPFMYVAGEHVMRDVMASDDSDGDESWRMEMEAAGFEVETPTVEHEGKSYYKGLGFLPKTNEIFLSSVEHGLRQLEEGR